jgi:archaetidylinositol phosphate synthase
VVLDRYRKAADAFLVPVASRMLGVNPNLVSWIAFLAAVGAGISFFIGGGGLLGLALVLMLVASYLDALDGKIAKMAGKASARGDFLDHVLDRYADVFMLGGIAFNAMYCRLGVGTLALLGVLLTSYMGTQAQAVGQGRAYGGVLGRADRLVLLFVGGLIQLLVAPSGDLVAGVGIVSFGPLEWFMVLFAVLGNATAVQRAVGIWRGLATPR